MSWPIVLDNVPYSAKAAIAAFGVSKFILDQAIALKQPATVGEMRSAICAYMAVPIRRRMTRNSRLWNNGGTRAADGLNKVCKIVTP